MKKILQKYCILLLCIMVALGMVACGNSNETADQDTTKVVNTDAAIERAEEALENCAHSNSFDYSLYYDEEDNIVIVTLTSVNDLNLMAWSDTEYRNILGYPYNVVSESLDGTGIGVYAVAYKKNGDFAHGWNGEVLD